MSVSIPSSIIRHLLAVALLLSMVPFHAVAQGQAAPAPDGVPEVVDEDFVIASLVIGDPCRPLYSNFGHAALRMQCPEYDLDYVFSYESEDVRDKVLRFFAGKLKMGMIAVPSELFINVCRENGRGLKQYELNLPVDIKRNLWKVLDDHLTGGIDLEYDYLNRGCAYGTLMILKEGLAPTKLQYGAWPEEYAMTRREICHNALERHKWTRCFLHLVINGEIDRKCSEESKTLTPAHLVEVLSNASVNGVPVISREPEIMVETSAGRENGWPSPMMVALFLLAATVICAVMKAEVMDYMLLVIQTALGILTAYLVFISSLVCTEWSWLAIPFNPLPLIFWKWRRKWALPYAVVLLIWCGFMVLWPHRLTDGAYVILALCLVISYLNLYLKTRSRHEK